MSEQPEPGFVTQLEQITLKASLILLAVLFIYLPVFHGGWIWDDNFELTQNAAIQDAGGIGKFWRGEAGADYLPLKSTLQWVLWHVFGNDPYPFHLASIGLHFVSALLFWRLLLRIGARHAWLGGLLFAVHPILVESVAWVSELKNTLSMTILLATMLVWLTFDRSRRWPAYSWALGLFVAALLCKTSVVMWPVIMLLYAWWKRGRITRGDVLASLPFFAASLASGVTTIWLQGQRAIGTEVFPLGGFPSRLALAGLNIVFYLWKIVLPTGLLPMYPRWRIVPPTLPEFLPWPFLAALGWWLWTKRRADAGRAALLGLGFFVVNLAPVLGFLKMSFMRIAWASDHFVYLPSLGIFGLAAAGLGTMYDGLHGGKRLCALGAGWLGLGLLVLASNQHAYVFSSMDAMCGYTLRFNPDAWVAHQLYAVVKQDQGDPDSALAHATLAVKLNPDVAETQNTLGTSLIVKGKPQEAIPHIQEAIRLAPDLWELNINLAKCLTQLGRFDEGLQQFLFLLHHSPGNAVFHCNAGFCLYKLGRIDEAVAEFRQALEINPNLSDARENLAVALKERSGESGTFQPASSP